ncbi:MAG: pantoate--beta-alanine ligase [Bacteroidia bacterium]|nr:pantoate--beta-alanine ligase [Bacteroidia bacterium]
MKVVDTAEELASFLSPLRASGGECGFVPTMGALHKGHISLLERSKRECSVTVSSIFVNPTQFNDPKDLETYPRTLTEDLRMLEQAGCDLVFVPSVQEVYGQSVISSQQSALLFQQDLPGFELGSLGEVMEGKFRPGHFEGMAVVVNRLFNIVKPDRAYFGKKDYQQLAIIKKMSLFRLKAAVRPHIEIIACDTVRESNGLALSSRNRKLSEEDRRKASRICSVLNWTKANAGLLTVGELQAEAEKQLKNEKSFQLEYFEIAGRDTLLPLAHDQFPQNAVACVALHLGSVRLIDNVEL